jgi:RNA polymerase sigma-70 factor (ECF subfamily)
MSAATEAVRPATLTDFDAGVIEFAPRLRAFIRRRVGSDSAADDLTQDTLLKVYRSRVTLRDGTKLVAWLYQIARGTIIDHYRRRRPQEELPRALAGESPDEVAALRAQVVGAMKGFLEELPERYREPVRLAELEGLPLARIALRLELSLPAVKSRVRRGRAMLRRKLQDCCRFEFDRLGQVIGYERRRLLCCQPEPELPAPAGRKGADAPGVQSCC